MFEVRNLAVYTLFVESDLPTTFGAAHPTAGRRHGSAQVKPDEIQATISPEFAFMKRHASRICSVGPKPQV